MRNVTQKSGVMVTAVNQLIISEIRITENSERQYSPVLSGDRPIAPKAATATTVAPSSGIAVCPTTSFAAVSPSVPCSIFTRIPSVTTIALSTSMPSAMTSAPSEMRSRMIPCICMMMNVPMIVTSRIEPMIVALRRPMNSISTTITIATASARLIRKPLIDWTTARDCNEMMLRSIPSGACDSSSARRRSTPSPITTTLPPRTVEMPKPTARSPL